MAPRLRTGRQIAVAALLLGALAGCSSSGGSPSAAPAATATASTATGSGTGGDAAAPSDSAATTGSPLPRPTATHSVKPPTEPTPTPTAKASGAARQPCLDLPSGYTAYAELSRAWTSGGRHLVSLAFEKCTFTPLNEENVSYTAVGAKRTLDVRPDAVIQVLNGGTQLTPVPFAHFSVSGAGQPYYYVRLDSSGAVAGVQQIYHP